MKTTVHIILLAFGLSTAPCSAQNWIPPTCPTPAPPGANFCDNICVNCNIDSLTGSTNGNNGATANLICGQINLQNPHWFGFVAGTSTIEFSIYASNCAYGNGIQAAIFEGCDKEALICNPGMSSGADTPLDLVYYQFIPGHTYILMIDGWAGDICDFKIIVEIGSVVTSPAEPVTTITGPATVCPGATVVYSVPESAFAGYYHWTAPPGAHINGGNNNVFIPSIGEFSNANTVTVTFGAAGGQICASAGNSCFPPSATACLDLLNNNQPIPPTILPPVSIPFDSLPYISSNGILNFPGPGVYNYQNNYASWLGCDSIVKQQINILPPSDGYIVGTVYWDANNNGVKDFGDSPYQGSAVVQSSSGTLTNTGIVDGKFTFANQSFGDTIRAIAPQPGLTVSPAFRILQPGVWTGYDFGLSPVPSSFDLKVTVFASAFRRGFENAIYVTCHNQALTPVSNIVLTLDLPLNLLDYIAADPSAFSINGNTMEWHLSKLFAGESRTFKVIVKTPVSIQLGTALHFSAVVTPVVNDINPVNNFYTYNTVVVGSYDPNDKRVEPAFVTPGMLANGQPFEYTIRFQNTGNYPAEFVRVVDTLGDLVDASSFHLLASSHPCTWKIRGTGVVEFLFENINLPDSTSNEIDSHGFVQFSVKPKKDLSLGTVVHNFCDIYFDYNAPVRTNTAGTKVVYFIPGDGLATQDALLVRPNPTAFYALCDWRTPAPADGRIRLFDVTGLPRLETPVEAGETSTHINVSTLSPGLYFVVLEAGNLILTNKLVVITVTPVGWN